MKSLIPVSLDHHMILQRLYDVNVSPSVLRWFQNYLIGRLHRVKRLGQYSDRRIMKGGKCPWAFVFI